jgi:CheY-like chemotaxis protein
VELEEIFMTSETKYQTVSMDEIAAKGLRPDSDRVLPIALVVDDEHLIADTVVAILRNQGIAASAAYDGLSALESARIIPPHLLISDVVMPGMSGIELAIAVQQEVPDCRVLLFSGQASNAEMLERARTWGFNFNFLLKPIHPADLLAEIWKLGCNRQESATEA